MNNETDSTSANEPEEELAESVGGTKRVEKSPSDQLVTDALDLERCFFDDEGRLESAVGLGAGLRMIGTFFPQGVHELRIATGYFSIAGYDLARKFMDDNVRIKVLVGQRQGSQLQQAIGGEMARVIREVMSELGSTGIPLAESVEELVHRINSGKFFFHSANEELPTGFKRRRFHCKFYVIDNAVLLTGSANFSRNGLSKYGNEENIDVSYGQRKVAHYKHFYDEQIENALDLLDPLRECLEEWINMYNPFLAYLKALLCLCRSNRFPVNEPGHKPAYYQEGVIVQAVEQVRKFGGTLLLVATGLGKTVIGAETARRLTLESSANSCYRIIIIAPKTTEDAWKKEMDGRGCIYEFFDNGTLFRSLSDTDEETTQVVKLEKCLASCDENSIFIFDEVHRYRNLLLNVANMKRKNEEAKQKSKKKDGSASDEEQKSHIAMDRLDQIVEQNSKIILLTATPYGTQKQNINSLLRILPPRTVTAGTGTTATASGTPAAQWSTRMWEVNHVTDVASLEVVTVLGMLHVLQLARDRGDADDGRLFLQMRDGVKSYLPAKISFHRVPHRLFLQEQMEQAFDREMFDGKMLPYPRWSEENGDVELGGANTWRLNTLRAWISSPLELARVLRIYSDKPDTNDDSNEKVLYKQKQAQRQLAAAPLLAAIATPDAIDEKLSILLDLLKTHRDKGNKVILFVKRRATAVYLMEHLRGSQIGSVECTVHIHKNNKTYELNTDSHRRSLIQRFAPEANPRTTRSMSISRSPIDIIILTDADGIVLNMQDANVVINYDLPLTVDELFQRAGRILRPTPKRDREVHIYSFVPDTSDSKSKAGADIQSIVKNLFERQKHANSVIDGGKILPSPDEEETIVMSLAYAADLDHVPAQYRTWEDGLQSKASSLSRHVSVFERNEDQANLLADKVVLSAKQVQSFLVKNDSICVIIQGPRGIEWTLFNLKTEKRTPSTLADVLDLLDSGIDEVKDAVSIKHVERAAIRAFDEWFEGKEAHDDSSNYRRVCAVYLRPQKAQDLDKAIRNILEV